MVQSVDYLELFFVKQFYFAPSQMIASPHYHWPQLYVRTNHLAKKKSQMNWIFEGKPSDDQFCDVSNNDTKSTISFLMSWPKRFVLVMSQLSNGSKHNMCIFWCLLLKELWPIVVSGRGLICISHTLPAILGSDWPVSVWSVRSLVLLFSLSYHH